MSQTSLPTRDFAAFLFDMDGTILTSIKAAERVWGNWAAGHGLDVAAFLPTIHGRRTEDTIRAQNLPGVDPAAEAMRITLAEIEDVEGVEADQGVADFLASLPAGRWAIVTSAPRRLAEARIAAAGLPLPPVLVAAEDVERGKPAPDPFLLGARTARRGGAGMPGVRGYAGGLALGAGGGDGERRRDGDACASARDGGVRGAGLCGIAGGADAERIAAA
jgi:phosphoglycolate phosphatase-like HAD superfamily hydrolase